MPTYNNGRQDAWIEALRESIKQQGDRIESELHNIRKRLTFLAGKVNHIYGGAAVLGAIAGLVAAAAVQFVIALIFR